LSARNDPKELVPKCATLGGKKAEYVPPGFCICLPGALMTDPARTALRVGRFIDLDQSAHNGPAHRPAMAGIDWTQVIGIATLVVSAAVICFVVFAL
jgi:hypothetical protein